MAYCKKCSRTIADGKNYCSSCWDIVWANYQNDKSAYETKLGEWNSLPARERFIRNEVAEIRTLRKFTFAPFLFADVIFVVIGFLGKLLGVFKFWLITAGIFAVGMIVTKLFSNILGRLFRGIFWALLLGGGLGIIGVILGSFYKDQTTMAKFQSLLDTLQIQYQVGSNAIVFGSLLALIGIILGILNEIRGRNHASGAPTMPTAPTP
jgi:MFS family permease